VEECQRIGYLAKIGSDHRRRQALREALNEVEEIRWWRRLVRNGLGRRGGHDHVVVLVVLEEIEHRADVRVALDNLALNPVVRRGSLLSLAGVPGRIPRPLRWENVRSRRDGVHDVDFNGDRPVLGMALPAISKNARLDDLLDNEWRLDELV
jgi:hypothetical protein